MKLDISKVHPTHNELRNPAVLPKLIDRYPFANHPKIIITEDGEMYCGDGHHRLVAADYKWGSIDMSMVDVFYLSYSKFLEVNFEVGWVTPYDPRTHCRLPDFYDYKVQVMSYHRQKMFVEADRLIENTVYTEPRTVNYISELTDRYLRNKSLDPI